MAPNRCARLPSLAAPRLRSKVDTPGEVRLGRHHRGRNANPLLAPSRSAHQAAATLEQAGTLPRGAPSVSGLGLQIGGEEFQVGSGCAALRGAGGRCGWCRRCQREPGIAGFEDLDLYLRALFGELGELGELALGFWVRLVELSDAGRAAEALAWAGCDEGEEGGEVGCASRGERGRFGHQRHGLGVRLGDGRVSKSGRSARVAGSSLRAVPDERLERPPVSDPLLVDQGHLAFPAGRGVGEGEGRVVR